MIRKIEFSYPKSTLDPILSTSNKKLLDQSSIGSIYIYLLLQHSVFKSNSVNRFLFQYENKIKLQVQQFRGNISFNIHHSQCTSFFSSCVLSYDLIFRLHDSQLQHILFEHTSVGAHRSIHVDPRFHEGISEVKSSYEIFNL